MAALAARLPTMVAVVVLGEVIVVICAAVANHCWLLCAAVLCAPVLAAQQKNADNCNNINYHNITNNYEKRITTDKLDDILIDCIVGYLLL